MEFLEKTLEDIIWDAIRDGESSRLVEKGLSFLESTQYTYRQFRIDGAGVADLISFKVKRVKYANEDWHYFITGHVIELKKGEIDVNAAIQVNRYVQYLKELLSIYDDVTVNVIPVLIGSQTSTNPDFTSLVNALEIECFEFKYTLNGIIFIESSPGVAPTEAAYNKIHSLVDSFSLIDHVKRSKDTKFSLRTGFNPNY